MSDMVVVRGEYGPAEHALSAPERTGVSWVLRCSCGWYSDAQRHDSDARALGAQHVIAVLRGVAR